MKPLVDIIIPMHNSEKYIKDCLLSVEAQDYQFIHIILIDDASDDNTLSIVKRYVNESKLRITLIIHSKSEGVSKSRNDGLNLLEGSFVTFLDSDDMISPIHISSLIDCAIKNPAKLVVSGNYRGMTVPRWSDLSNKRNELFLDKETLMKSVLGFGQIQGYPWNKLFLNKTIIEMNLRFDESLFICEDLVFVSQYLLASGVDGVFTGYQTYFYRLHDGSALGSRRNKVDIQKKGNNEWQAYKRLSVLFLDYSNSIGIFLNMKKLWVLNNTINLYIKFDLLGKNEMMLNEYKKLVNNFGVKLIVKKFVPIKPKVSFILRYISNTFHLILKKYED